MANRIICRTPSTGRAISVRKTRTELTSNVYVTIAETPDFSVPDPNNSFGQTLTIQIGDQVFVENVRDPNDVLRAIRPGELFFLTPLSAKNVSGQTAWVDARIVSEFGEIVELGRIIVPANDTAFFPLQGRSLFKRKITGTVGDKLQVRAQFSDTFDVWAAAEERPSNEHSGIENIIDLEAP